METPEVTIVGSGKAAPWRRKFTRFRLFTLAVLAALVTVAGVAVWRMRSLDGLPDVGDPFDVSEAARPIPISDEDNAFVSYDAARRMLTTLTLANARSLRKPSTWSNADQQARDYLEQNRLALEKWREGSERPDAIYHQPNEMSVDIEFADGPTSQNVLPASESRRLASRRAGGHGRRVVVVHRNAARAAISAGTGC